eukprot:9431169-Ditylum_brightwellii.AAC.1
MKSLAKAEIVGMDDLMPQVLWTRYFMEAQGYKVNDNTVYQDNKSEIRLKKNGKGSSNKCTRHINICYFVVTNQTKTEELI